MRDEWDASGDLGEARAGMRKTVAVLGAIITCPCHVPIWLVLLGGTAVGTALVEHGGLILVTATLCFGGFLWLALRNASWPREASERPAAGRR